MAAAACTGGAPADRHRLSSASGPAATQRLALSATWTSYQLSQPVSGAAAVSIGDQVLLVGGSSGRKALSSVTRLTPLTGQERPAGALAMPATAAAAAIVHGSLTAFGGAGGAAAAVQRAGQAGHPGAAASGAAHGPVRLGRLPEARSGPAAVPLGNVTYLVGGGSPGHPAAGVLATTDGAHFKVVAKLRVPVAFAGAVAAGGQLWVFGGMTGSGPTDVIQRVDPDSGRVTVAGHLPRPLSAESAFVLGRTIFLAGGSTGSGRAAVPDARAPKVLSTGRPAASAVILAVDPRTSAVSVAGVLPAPVAHAATAIVGRTAYLMGGTDGARVVPAVVTLRLLPAAPRPPMPWLAPPSLPGHLATGSDPSALPADVLVADHLNNRLVIIDPQGRIRWVFPKPGDLAPGQTFRVPDDAFFSPDGRYIVATQEGDQVVSIISVATGKIVYRYGKPGTPGMGPNRVSNPDDALLLPGGDLLISDIRNCRILIIHPPEHRPERIIGQSSNVCMHEPPRRFSSPNGAFPMSNGGYVVTEINGDWADGIGADGRLRWSAQAPGVLYPSDTNEVYPGCYLTADYSNPGQVVEFTTRGRLRWRFGGLNQPSLAIPLPNGNILVNDDFNHRIIVIDPATNRIVWQYGHTGVAGRAPGYLNDPDGLDLVPPDSFLIRNAATMGRP
jgi:outer membrane protein assembly factor BamB